MFKSFFPDSRWFWPSVVIWAGLTTFIWLTYHVDIGAFLGLHIDSKAKPVIGLGFFITNKFLLFYLYYAVALGLFAAFWFQLRPNKWQWWSITGTALILFVTYFSVQVSVVLNYWNRVFFNDIQTALSGKKHIPADQFYSLLTVFFTISCLYMIVAVMNSFFVSHYVFRWRTAMNDYYTSLWPKVRHIEGASQRVQEDTMRFASIVEGLGISFINAIMTLIAFLPLLWSLSKYVTELPIVGKIPEPLFSAAIFWAVFGTLLLAIVGIKLPGLEFKNQRVEAAYRKELVYGEDDESRAQPETLSELFSKLRKNYFRLYFNYLYFNVARNLYLQADNIFVLFFMVPTFVAGKITLGIYSQISLAFGNVSGSFQYLVNSWSTIVDLISVYKRLKSFEAAINDEALPKLEQTVS